LEIQLRHQQGDFRLEIDFAGAESGVTALFGPSGAGKTTIVNMVAGLQRPNHGRIDVNGFCLFDAVRGIDLPPEKRRIGYVFQDGRLLPHLSVRKNLTYGMRLTPASRRFVKFDPVVDLLGIDHLLERRPARLSGGEKQRVAIGRALLTSPALLLMDEPLASLDKNRKDEVLPFIMRLGREFAIPILYVSHAIDEIINLAAHLVLIRDGRVIASGDLTELLARAELQTFFGAAESGAVLATTVSEPQDDSGLTHLCFGNHTLKIPRIPFNRGDAVRVRIPARHVAIALEAPRHTSFQNIYACKVCEIIDNGTTFVDIRLDVGAVLWARITRLSMKELELTPGQLVYVLIKSVSIAK